MQLLENMVPSGKNKGDPGLDACQYLKLGDQALLVSGLRCLEQWLTHRLIEDFAAAAGLERCKNNLNEEGCKVCAGARHLK